MITKVPSWTTSDSKIHTNYVTALKHELGLWFAKAGDNEVGARKIVDALDETAIETVVDHLNTILAELKKPSTFQVVVVESAAIPEIPTSTNDPAVVPETLVRIDDDRVAPVHDLTPGDIIQTQG